MTRLLDELDDHHQILHTFYGSKIALGFRGTGAFIERCFNLVYNCDITNGRLYALGRNLGYVVVGPKRQEKGPPLSPEQRLLKGLCAHFYQELIGTGDVKPLNPEWIDSGDEPRWDEEELERRALRMAKDFRMNHLVSEAFLEPPNRSLAAVYGAPMAEVAARSAFAPDSFDRE